MYDDGTHGDVTSGDVVYTALLTVATAGRYEFKVASEDWSTSYPIAAYRLAAHWTWSGARGSKQCSVFERTACDDDATRTNARAVDLFDQ